MKRVFGYGAATVAALVLALTPVTVAMASKAAGGNPVAGPITGTGAQPATTLYRLDPSDVG